MGYKWNPNANRYQWVNGRSYFVSSKTVINWIESSLQSTGAIADTLASMVYNLQISPKDWNTLMRQHIKDETIRQYITAIGGRQNMNQSDWGKIGAMVKEQYGYFDGFYKLVQGGNLTEGQVRSRARMYINSAREAFEKATQKVAIKWGADEVRWVRDLTVENCPGCADYSALGWVKIKDDKFKGNYPGSGGTVCLTSCHCHLEYRNSKTGKVFMED